MSARTLRLRFGMALLAIALAGCQTGPRQLRVASAHYSDAVRVAEAEGLLANLVRLRYRDNTTFLAVSNISTQFEFDTFVAAESDVATPGADVFGLGAGIRYAERPTISFSILGGESFQKRVLRPIAPSAISLVTDSGWRVDRVLRLTVEGINGVRNAPTASGPTPSREPQHREFLEATGLLHSLFVAKRIDFEYELRREPLSAALPASAVDGEHSVMAVKAGTSFERLPDGRMQLFVARRRLVMRLADETEGHPDMARLRDLLGLQAGRRHYDVLALADSEFDPYDRGKRVTQIGIDTRSLAGILYYLSHGVRVPPEDAAAGTVTTTLDSQGQPWDWSNLLGGIFEVRTSDGFRRPENAAIAVRHRGHWFYIADDDETSKSTFLLLGQLFTLQAGDVEDVKPVLTLPVGG